MLPGAAHRDAPTGSVAVVGLGPGDTDWMTRRAAASLPPQPDPHRL